MRLFATIALWLGVQWTLMPLCLCQEGHCPSLPEAAVACCQNGLAEVAATQAEAPSSGGCGEDAPCPHCEGGETTAISKPASAPEPKLQECPETAFACPEPSPAASAAEHDGGRFESAPSAPSWWAAESSRLSVFLI